ncbi:hypothetical protein [Pseudomonas sp. CFBP 13602]|uniref:hypothetical protein n=1 Tax=Pseudomonas sp. CFBP 13602 TaxID=2774039 RepID=UPI0017862D07|nr:hypothetical protein [Pseudomonas sp. CFBP 13602]MBD8826273.1 hypothetical protein [Pseudomonas sp. CFBP 13602]
MDINEQRTPIDEPVSEFHEETMLSILRSLKQTYMPSGKTNADAKSIVNSMFEVAQDKLRTSILKGNSASWMLEAYKQIFMWTSVYRGGFAQPFHSPKEMAPVGRFGWRFVIEHILSGGAGDSLQRRQPSYEEVSKVFTILSVMMMAAEWSNLIHFFPDVYGDVEFDLTDPFGMLMPKLPPKSKVAMQERAEYMRMADDDHWNRLSASRRAADELYLNKKLSNALQVAKGFTLEDIEKLIDVMLREVLSSGAVLIIPGEYLVDWLVDESDIPKPVVVKILNFILLSSKDFMRVGGDFLDKKDPIRMINFAGIRLDRLKYLTSIYPKASVSKPHIKKASWHVIVNIFMVAEWHDIFKHRSAIGQRLDLKGDAVLNRSLEEIEQYHRRNIFESVVFDIFAKCSHDGIKGLKKWTSNNGGSVALPCGEIDIIAFDEVNKIFYVVECKASAPATDSRGQFQQFKDHFIQKKYHDKFLSKIKWVSENLAEIARYKAFSRSEIDLANVEIVPLMVTRYPSIVKFYVEGYRVLTYVELDVELSRESTA